MTCVLATGIVVVAILNGTLRHPLPAESLERWGFGLRDLIHGDLWRLATAPWLILRPVMALTIVASVLFCCGIAEWLAGTRRALIAAVLGHVAGYVLAPLLLTGLGAVGVDAAARMAAMRDVGASNAVFGAAGLAVAWLPRLVRRRALLAVSGFLVVALVVSSRRWDVEHAIAFPMGYACGLAMLRVSGAVGSATRRRPERHQRPLLIAWVVTIAGLVNVLSALSHHHAPSLIQLEAWLPIVAGQPPRMLVLASGLALLLLAPAIARRRRAAWTVAVLLLVGGFLLHLPWQAHRIEALLTLGQLGVLLIWAPVFSVPSDLAAVRRGRLLLLAVLIALPVLGVPGVWLTRSGFAGAVDLESAVREVGASLVFAQHERLVPESLLARGVVVAIPLVGWAGVLAALALILKGVSARPRSRSDEERARSLVMEYGETGTAYMTLWPGNSFAFDPRQRSFVAYRVASEVAVVLGEPVGAPDARAGMIVDFAAFASAHGWDHVFYAVTAASRDMFMAAGYDLIQIGEEAVIPLGQLAFKGKEWQDIRSAVNRAGREGLSFAFYEGGSVPAAIRRQFDEISAEWEASQHLPPMEFTLGRTADVDDPEVYVAAAVDATGRVQAFVDWLPVPARRGWVIDLMRRRDDALGGIMDFLIGMSLLAFQERGQSQASLATAPLAAREREGTESPLARLLDFVYRNFDAFYHFQTLFRFKQKFQPRWEPIYLAYRGEDALLRATQAIARAHLPDLNLVTIARAVSRAVGERWQPEVGKPGGTDADRAPS
ncbi:MAG: DUF2156 domain-containing protein [Candidatus Krumholzibacteriia bacterium]